MSNLNLEINSEEPNANRPPPHLHPSANPTKKKSGFQITSVTDSGHGRPSLIARDGGEESADDLDESHASYSDVSYSRATDADHDQESTASEDTLNTLNTSVHESANIAHVDGGVNHVAAIHHHHAHHSLKGHDISLAANAKLQKDTLQELKKGHHATPISFPTTTYNKEHSEHLDSPQELPHDNMPGETIREKNTDDPEKKVDLPQGSGSNVKVESPQSVSEQMFLNSTTTVASSNISSIVTTQPSMLNASADAQPSMLNASADAPETVSTERPSIFSTASIITSTTTTTKAVSVSSSITGLKAPGTRVYKVVKREAIQPTKRARGRWNSYDFSDTQAPMTGISQSVGEPRIANDSSSSLHTFTFTNTLMSANVGPYSLQQSDSASSLLKDRLLKAGLSNASSNINWETGGLKSDSSHGMVMGLGADVLKTAMKKCVTGAPGDSSTGDTSAAARTLKIDNKIEAAMDLVKKHLMSAVRDEVDELKEKIKDLKKETTRLKTENKELRAALPVEVASQVQTGMSPPKDVSAKEDNQNADKTSLSLVSNESTAAQLNVDHVPQKVMNVSKAQDGSLPILQSGHPTDHKAKITSSNASQNTTLQNLLQDIQKTAVTTTSLVGGQPVVTAQVHMQMSQPQGHNQQNVDPQLIMHEQGTQDNLKVSANEHDPNFDKKNPP